MRVGERDKGEMGAEEGKSAWSSVRSRTGSVLEIV